MSARQVKQKELKDRKFILRRANNGRKREKKIAAAVYGIEKEALKRLAKEEARKHGYRDMSISALINMRMLLP